MRQIGVMVDAGEHVEQRTLGRCGEARAVGGEDRHAERLGQRHERLVVGLFVAPKVALQFDVGAIAAKQADDAIEQAADAEPLHVERRAPDERDESAGHAVERVDRQRAFAFRRARASCA